MPVTTEWVAENENEAADKINGLEAQLRAADMVRERAKARAAMMLVILASAFTGVVIGAGVVLLLYRPLDRAVDELRRIAVTLQAHGVVKEVSKMIDNSRLEGPVVP